MLDDTRGAVNATPRPGRAVAAATAARRVPEARGAAVPRTGGARRRGRAASGAYDTITPIAPARVSDVMRTLRFSPSTRRPFSTIT